MNETQAKLIVREIETLLQTHGLFYTKSLEYKGGLHMIRLTDITIKVTPSKDTD